MSRFTNKVAVITGGNSGIGLAAAQQFAAQGAKVVIFGRNAETLAQAANSIDGEVLAVQGDVLNFDDLGNLYAQTAANFGKVDALFVNAGVIRMAPIDQVTESLFDHMVDINFKGAYFTIQKALPYLNDGGAIVLNSSIAANIGMAGASVYAASKAAVISLARSLSAELVARNIRVNVVSPGPIQTPIYGTLGMSEEQLNGFAEQIQGQVPLGRFGNPDEIANAVTFLASDEASFIVGEEITVDGGMSTL